MFQVVGLKVYNTKDNPGGLADFSMDFDSEKEAINRAKELETRYFPGFQLHCIEVIPKK